MGCSEAMMERITGWMDGKLHFIHDVRRPLIFVMVQSPD
jgi:hypothetical protein